MKSIRFSQICASVLCCLVFGNMGNAALLINGEEARVQIVHTSDSPKIDGRLNEAIWSQVSSIGPYAQVEPIEGAKPSERTMVYLIYDERNIYVGVRCFDRSPKRIVANQMGRDGDMKTDDRFAVVFDTFRDRRNGYLFEINPNGARLDGLSENNRVFRGEWDGIWWGRARIDSQGWTAEMKIPFQTLRFNPESSNWGFNSFRVIRRHNEVVRWTNWYQNRRTIDMAGAGVLEGLENISQGLGIDIMPSSALIRQHDPAISRDVTIGDPSLDLSYKLTPSTTGVLTFNTDFSENFPDERQLNVSQFDEFFPETRDFFLEDSGSFEGFGNLDQNGRPYFSRKVGMLFQSLGLEVPVQTPIRAAAKVSGRLGPWNIGLLDAQTTSQGDIERKNLAVVRATYDVLEESTIGLIATRGDPSSDRDNNLVGFDFRFRSSNLIENRIVQAEVWSQRTSTSDLSGDSEAYGIKIHYPNDRWRGMFGFQEIKENFFPGLGFANRTGMRRYEGKLRRRWRPETWLRTIDTMVEGRAITGSDSRIESAYFRWYPFKIATQQGDKISLGSLFRYENLRDSFEIANNVVLQPQRRGWGGLKFGFETADYRPVNIGFEYAIGSFWNGTLALYRGNIGFRPSKHLTIRLYYFEYDGSLDEGDFTKRLVRSWITVGITPDLAWETLIQYDNVTETLGAHSRIHWTLSPGNDCYLIFGVDGDADGHGFRGTRSRGIAKIRWTFRF